jgi:hypothetical protein
MSSIFMVEVLGLVDPIGQKQIRTVRAGNAARLSPCCTRQFGLSAWW